MTDLHMHSRYSEDGEYTPVELVKQCMAHDVHIMFVTDHNCARANLEAQVAAKAKGILYIPGIEIDCIYKDTNFHVLGYGIDYQSKDFECIEKNIEDIIHRNHGIAVLVYPCLNLKNKENLLDEILEIGIDGIEAFSSYHTSMQAKYYYQKACERQIIVICGSDYHGKTKPSIGIGKHGCLISYEDMQIQLEKVNYKRY